MVNAERYITDELKEYESKILNAEENIIQLENKTFLKLINKLIPDISKIQKNAALIAYLDCLLSFSEIAKINNYNKPIVIDADAINIISKNAGTGFRLNDKNNSLLLLTDKEIFGF